MTKILFVTTNFSKINDDILTGVYLEEFAVPYLTFDATGYDITTASPKGGNSPIDEKSLSCSNPMEWDEAAKNLKDTKKLEDIDIKDFDVLFLPGGHGPMFDLAYDKILARTVQYFYENDKIISSLCHGVAGLISAKTSSGEPVVKGKTLTSFTDREEEIVKMTEFMPFLLEDKLIELGANYIAGKQWSEHVEIDGNLITGQNQNCALLVAEETIKLIDSRL